MKKFEAPSLEIVEFNAQDVITTSGECQEDCLPICTDVGGGTQTGCGSGGSDMLCEAW